MKKMKKTLAIGIVFAVLLAVTAVSAREITSAGEITIESGQKASEAPVDISNISAANRVDVVGESTGEITIESGQKASRAPVDISNISAANRVDVGKEQTQLLPSGDITPRVVSYFSGSVSQDEWDYHTFAVGDGAYKVKVRIDWDDPNNDLSLWLFIPGVGWVYSDNPKGITYEEIVVTGGSLPTGTWKIGVHGDDVTGTQEYAGIVVTNYY